MYYSFWTTEFWNHFGIIQIFMKSLYDFRVLKWACLFHCCNSSQYFKKLYKSVSVRERNLKFRTATSSKATHQIPKNVISVAESLNPGQFRLTPKFKQHQVFLPTPTFWLIPKFWPTWFFATTKIYGPMPFTPPTPAFCPTPKSYGPKLLTPPTSLKNSRTYATHATRAIY